MLACFKPPILNHYLPACLQMMPVDDFLGPYLPPQNLTLAALAATKAGDQGAFAARLATYDIKLTAITGKQHHCLFQQPPVLRSLLSHHNHFVSHGYIKGQSRRCLAPQRSSEQARMHALLPQHCSQLS
jgi:hypothetical protein